MGKVFNRRRALKNWADYRFYNFQEFFKKGAAKFSQIITYGYPPFFIKREYIDPNHDLPWKKSF